MQIQNKFWGIFACGRTIASVILVVLLVLPEGSETLEFEHGANLRQNALLMKWPSGMNQYLFPSGSFGISETRIRVWSSVHSGGIVVNGALETRAGFLSSSPGNLGDGILFSKSRPLAHWDLTTDHIDELTTSLSTRIERLDIRWRLGNYDINIGRQPISLGTSHFISVLDVLAPFAPGDLDATYKPGIDAVRIRRGLGMSGEVEIIAAGARKWSDGAVLGRYRTSLKGIDFEFVGGRFRRRSFGGLGWEGDVMSTGIWGEMALFGRREDAEKNRGGFSKAAFSSVAGLDFNLPAKFKLGGSFMFQDFGVRDPDDLIDIYEDAPFREGWVFLGSVSYGVFTLHRELHPLVQSDLAGIINLIDNSTLWQPKITINTGNNTDLAFYGWFGTGAKPRIRGTTLSIGSEFGGMPDGGGFYARWFF